MERVIPLAAAAALFIAGPVAAEIEISLYTGAQSAPHSRASGDYPGGGSYDGLIGWEGKSFAMPPYYGLRAVWWQSETLGFGAEFTHAKVYADKKDAAKIGFSHLEFTDGINILTANVHRRWPGLWMQGKLTPYVAAGLGISVPHVEADTPAGSSIREYQMTGPALRLTAGLSYEISDRYAMFGEYQFTASDNQADLDRGGSLDTVIKTNALNIGISYRF